jgi:hypothetical protein
MPLDFPNSPINGQTFTSGGVTWVWNGTTWTMGSAVGFLPLTGGTLSGPGNLTVNGAMAVSSAGIKYGAPDTFAFVWTGTVTNLWVNGTNTGALATVGQLSGYLPLTAGPTVPLTGPLTLTSSSNTTINFINTVPANTAGGLWRIRQGTVGNLNFEANTAVAGDFSASVQGLQITSLGAVGIGISNTPTDAVAGTTMASSLVTSSSTAIYNNAYNTSGGGKLLTAAAALAFNMFGGTFNFYHAPSAAAGSTPAWTQVFSIDAVGNAYLTGNKIWFAGVSTGNGPIAYGDLTNMSWQLGTGNGGWTWWNNPGAQAMALTANGVLTVTSTLTTGGYFTSGANCAGTYPPGGNFAIGWNFNTGAGEVDFWNLYTSASSYNTFHWRQLTGTNTSSLLMQLGPSGLLVNSTFLKTGGGPSYRMCPNTDNTGYGSFWYTDGSNVYLLLTNNNDAWGSFNGLRPFVVNLANGLVTLQQGLIVTGGSINLQNGSSGNTFITYNGSNYVQMFDDGNGHIECNTPLWLNGNTTQQVHTGGELYVASNLWIGGLYWQNNGGWMYSGNNVQVNGTLQANGTLIVGGISIYNDGSPKLYSNYSYRSPNLYADGSIFVNGLQFYNNGNWWWTGSPIHSDSTVQGGAFQVPGGAYWQGSGTSMYCSSAVYTGSIWPVGNNGYSCGVSGTAWAQVASYWFNTISSRAEKDDIVPLSSALDRVRELHPVSFRWKRDDGKRHAGFIADEVAAVMGSEDFGGYDMNEDGNEGIAYNELTAVLWKACQELAASNTALAARVAALEAR